ncbi:NAD(P)H-hydrate dehydratase [Oricola thermophila]|uniref:Bifunctional NAD(P)H-hydrate repair enzyme n=1 Tax=Oricola thermophila TaxID=2742145 RepID=A0A6N1VNQ1_9HYPH|nr:NAD(P)H-hydrate dehydratase [Oricola thermophila]
MSHAVLACEQMAHADRWTIENAQIPGTTLMENAGAAVARAVLERFGHARRALVLCGPGNNGGDGYVAARILQESGMSVTAYAFGTPRGGTDAAIARSRYSGAVEPPEEFEPSRDDVVVDAIFGAGLTRDLPERVLVALHKARSATCPVVAVDLPSGVNGDSGADLGGALTADVTVTFFRKKPGHLLFPGRQACGEVVVADIGVRAEALAAKPPVIFENVPQLWGPVLPKPDATWHKYSRGHAAVFSGGKHATGAARLAALAAQRTGAGAVTILGQPDALDIHAAHLTSIMLRPCAPDDSYDRLGELKGCRACVLGPGFGDFTTARRLALSILQEADRTGLRLVLDADGITAFASESKALFDVAHAVVGQALVLTPHEGEFGRLFPDLAEDRSLSKVDKAVAAAARANAVVLYKGPDTVVAAPDGRAAINTNATSSLATAGSGDVLSGVIGGLVAQGLPLWEAACAAAWLHGEAGGAAGPLAVAEDIVARIPVAFGLLNQGRDTRAPWP